MATVIQPPRSAPSNATTSGLVNNGVDRSHYALVDVAGDMFRGSYLNSTDQIEYLVWAANTSSFSIKEDPTWTVTGTGNIPPNGSLPVPPYIDGSDSFIVQDSGGRTIAGVLSCVVRTGGGQTITINSFASVQNNRVTLSPDTLAELGGGLSPARGDQIASVSCYLESPRFWFARNDADRSCFGWNGSAQRWEPYRGSPPQQVGVLARDTEYTLTSVAGTAGDYLPFGVTADSYAMLRLGILPDANSTPLRVLLVETISETFPPDTDAQLQVDSGRLVFNSTIQDYGLPIWWIRDTYDPKSRGDLGPLSSPLFLSPIPLECPFLSIGNRRPLTAIAVATDADLAVALPASGQVYWSRSTGRIKLAQTDIAKADPESVDFDLLYLGAHLYSNGESLTATPLSPIAPVEIVDSVIPLSTDRNTSGIRLVPDGTGTIPNESAVPGTRPNGCGLVRAINTIGESLIFSKAMAFAKVLVVEFDKDLPVFTFSIPQGTVYVSLESGTIRYGAKDQKTIGTDALYFLQCMVNLSDNSGLCMGFFRSPINLDRSSSAPDVSAYGVVRNGVVQSSIVASPVQFLNPAPLEDIPGYDEGVFFQTVEGSYARYLQPYQDVIYNFPEKLFYWVQSKSYGTSLQTPTNDLFLGSGAVVGQSLYPAVGGGLYLSVSGEPKALQRYGEDYVLSPDTGVASLSLPIGELQLSGYRGSILDSHTFEDLTADFSAVTGGFRLQIGTRSYRVVQKLSAHLLEVDNFYDLTGNNLQWNLYQGFPKNTYDNTILADVVYEPFSHLSEEPFKVRILTALGTCPDLSPAYRTAGRLESLRMGLAGPTVSLAPLLTEQVGKLANGSLSLPAVDKPFKVQIGNTLYVPSGVTAFTTPLLGDVVEYGVAGSDIEGQLQFGEETLSVFADSLVYYAQQFSGDLAEGLAEVNAQGDVNLSPVDLLQYAGETVYYVEQLNAPQEVTLSPLIGAFHITKPVREGQIVEVQYRQASADGTAAEGAPITEMLPVYVRQKAAEYLDDYHWSLNTDRTIPDGPGFQAWVDDRLLNYGAGGMVARVGSVLRFTKPVGASHTVKVNYAVLEAFGGEQSYTTSKKPVYRPPFQADGGTFTLDSDRTGEMVPGKLLRVGATPVYIAAAELVGGSTRVTVYPALPLGNRTPGRDQVSVISSVPVTDSVNGVPTAGGFLLPLSLPFQPADQGSLDVVFQASVGRFVVAGHLLEVDGVPYIVAHTVATEAGWTVVSLTTPLVQAVGTTSSFRVSVRPLYPPQATTLLGGQPMLSMDLIRYALGEPGKTLTPTVDYVLDSNTGNVELSTPMQPGDLFQITGLAKRVVQPIVQDNVIILPTYQASYLAIQVPQRNESKMLLGSYTYSNPDSYYTRILPLTDYQGEVANIALARVSSQTPYGGGITTAVPRPKNWEFGTVSVIAQIRDLKDQDRAARQYLTSYNDLIVSFEQVQETISGYSVGDWDGKFRFNVGRDLPYAKPGDEDDITGYIECPRFIWGDVFRAINGTFSVNSSDPLVDPETATQDPGTLEVSGTTLDPWRLHLFTELQKQYVLNDIDDLVLTDRYRPSLKDPVTLQVHGAFNPLWVPSVVSRLYPESTTAFTTTYPGIGTTGVYSFAKTEEIQGKFTVASTFLSEIATVSNPSFGVIDSIVGQVKFTERLPRARIWDYSPTGFPDLDPASEGLPSIIATPLSLSEFPVDAQTGLPALSMLSANGGSYPDLSTGDTTLSNPKWAEEIQVAFGRPNGDTYQVGTSTGLVSQVAGMVLGSPILKGLQIKEVLSGCILTFTDDTRDVKEILRVDGEPFAPQRGDTIFGVPASSSWEISATPTVAEAERVAQQTPYLDVAVSGSSVLDVSLPSAADPSFPLKELLHQKAAAPLMAIEAKVALVNRATNPMRFPALLGSDKNDSGDYGKPYLASVTSELDVLGAVRLGGMLSDTAAPEAEYPNEILGNDGEIAAGVLTTTIPLLPSYSAGSGVMPAQPYDLLWIEPGASGSGIRSVGAVTGDTIKVPRFVSQTKLGDRIRYQFDNVMSGSSIVATEVGADTTITQSNVDWSGLTALVSGGNKVTIQFFDGSTLIETLTYSGTLHFVQGGAGGSLLGSPPVFTATTMSFGATGIVSNLGVSYSYTVSIDTYNGGALTAGSTTAYVASDRLTFFELLDFSSCKTRSEAFPGELSIIYCTASGIETCTVNSAAEVNGGLPFTFLQTGTVGSIEVPSWEDANTPITGSNLTFAVAPSSVVASGTAPMPDIDPKLTEVSVSGVLPGDVVVIASSDRGDASVKSGTYLVRYALEEHNPVYAVPYTAEQSYTIGITAFPKIDSADSTSIIISGISLVPYSPTGHSFPSSGTLYCLTDFGIITNCVRVDYNSVSWLSGDQYQFSWVSGTAQRGDGSALSDGEFLALALAGVWVSGMRYLRTPISIVGFDNGVGGIQQVSMDTYVFPTVNSTGGVPGADELGVWVSVPPYVADSTVYQERDAIVYQQVPFLLDLGSLTQWDTIHSSTSTMQCLLPGDSFDIVFLAEAGIFLEPSFPYATAALNAVSVVDAGHTYSNVGQRKSLDFGVLSESVAFTVKRIRRFHSVQNSIEYLTELRKTYEIRTGTILSVIGNNVTSVSGTQLGGFTTVGITSGDLLRILDGEGQVLDSAEISTVLSDTSLTLRPPGFRFYLPTGGETFEIYLRKAPVPLAQSHAQLLGLITESEVLGSATGQATTTNQLRDPTVSDFTLVGVAPGDIVLIDPAGRLAGTTEEYGSRPFGGVGVPARAEYQAGVPSELDDNRGWYRVLAVEPGYLEVNPVTAFSGGAGNPAVFGAPGQETALYPVVEAEGQMDLRATAPIASGTYTGNAYSIEPFQYRIIRPKAIVSEETVDLILFMRERLLSWMELLGGMLTQDGHSGDYNTFQADEHISDLGDVTDYTSGKGVVSNAMIAGLSGNKDVSPFVNTADCLSILDRRYWCRDGRLDGEAPIGSSVPYTSFQNVYGGGLTVGSGRPNVCLDLIDGVLDRTDMLREMRYSWIKFRTNRKNGTLFEIQRFEQSLPERLAEQEEYLRLKSSMG